MFNALYSNIVLFETNMCILTWYAVIVLQCSTSMVEDSSSAFASMKCHSDEVISSDEDLTSFDEPTTTDMEGLECNLEM